MNATTDDPFTSLAASRQPLVGDLGVEHKMVKVGDELTGTITEAATVDTKFGERSLIKVEPVRAISDGVDVTMLGETKLWCSGFELEAWFKREQPEAGNLVSIALAELVDTGKGNPLKHFETALKCDPGSTTDDNDPGVDVDQIVAAGDDDIPW